MATTVNFEREPGGYCCTSSQSANTFQKQNARDRNQLQDEILKEGFDKLSIEEHAQVDQEVLGLSNNEKENPSHVLSSLAGLEEAIRKINGRTRIAYDLAMQKDSTFVENKAFRLMFLRADDFSIQKAANRMMQHFDVKLKLFGEEKLARDIIFDDLNANDQASASTGSHQLLFKDIKGRTIIFIFPELLVMKSWENIARAQWYHFMVALEEGTLQRLGLVAVVVGTLRQDQILVAMRSQSTIIPALPIRPAAVHACCLKQAYPRYIKQVINAFGYRFKARFHLHVEETVTGLLYALQLYGIDPANVPLEHDGRPYTKMFLDRLEERKTLERQGRRENVAIMQASASDVGIKPTSRDVILGKGIKHPGNSALDDLVDMEIVSYKRATVRFKKSWLIINTIKRVEASGGRFLKRDRETNEYIVVEEGVVHAAVSGRFRAKARKIT